MASASGILKKNSAPCVFDVVIFYFLYANVKDSSDASMPE